jgi:hypothetical protein
MLKNHFIMNTEEIYRKGFNTGYCISRYEPKLADTLATGVSNTNDFFQGFFDGKEQVQLEKNKEQLQHLMHLRNKGKNLERDFS